MFWLQLILLKLGNLINVEKVALCEYTIRSPCFKKKKNRCTIFPNYKIISILYPSGFQMDFVDVQKLQTNLLKKKKKMSGWK